MIHNVNAWQTQLSCHPLEAQWVTFDMDNRVQLAS